MSSIEDLTPAVEEASFLVPEIPAPILRTPGFYEICAVGNYTFRPEP